LTREGRELIGYAPSATGQPLAPPSGNHLALKPCSKLSREACDLIQLTQDLEKVFKKSYVGDGHGIRIAVKRLGRLFDREQQPLAVCAQRRARASRQLRTCGVGPIAIHRRDRRRAELTAEWNQR
jgi:hypothetical protein